MRMRMGRRGREGEGIGITGERSLNVIAYRTGRSQDRRSRVSCCSRSVVEYLSHPRYQL